MPLERLGPFKLDKLLGRGGMGAVYVGLNEASGERAAVKVLSGHLADDAAFRERFKQEIETLKRLLHPNIVQLHGYGEEDGHLYYVMELVNGKSLQDELAAGRRFTWREVTRIGVATAQALKHAHDRGIIHRDLKPANLLLDQQEHVKLTDFGIAKLYGGSNVTAEGGVLGTADYMAPEQAEGTAITSRCDLYALGSVLYALLTGKPPFGGRSIVEVIAALRNDKPIPVRRLAPDTPAEFENIIQQLLEKDPQKRIPTALAVANRLRAMEHGLSLETRVGLPQPEDPDWPPESPDAHSARTASVNPASGKTVPLPSDQEAEYRLAPDAPTMATSGGKTPSSRTAMGTQSGKKTGASSDSGRGTEATHAPGGTANRPAEPPTKVTRFTTVSEEELRGQRETDDASLRQWLLVGGLAAVAVALIAGVAWYATRPPSADRLYAVAKAAADRGGAEELAPIESDLSQFRALYPNDPRAAEIQDWQRELEQYRLGRRVKLLARKSDMLFELTPVERAYQEAEQLSAADPEAALTRFEALVAVYSDAPHPTWTTEQQRTATELLALARKQAERLRPLVQRMIAEEQAAIRGQLARADKLAGEDRDAAERIWQGIATLYSGKGWARQLVEEARAKLEADKH